MSTAIESRRFNVALDEQTIALLRELSHRVRRSQNDLVQQAVCWLAEYLKKSPSSIKDIEAVGKISEHSETHLTIRVDSNAAAALTFLRTYANFPIAVAVRAAVKVCSSYVLQTNLEDLQESILESNWQRYVSQLRTNGFRIIDISNMLIENPKAVDIFFLLVHEPFALVKGSTSVAVIARPVSQHLAFWKTGDEPTQRIQFLLTDLIGDLAELSHLDDPSLVERLRTKWLAITALHGWEIRPEYGPREKKLRELGVRFDLYPQSVGRFYTLGTVEQGASQLGLAFLRLLDEASKPLGDTPRTQPKFGIISVSDPGPNPGKGPYTPGALVIALDPNRRVQLQKMLKTDERVFSSGTVLTQKLVKVLDDFIVSL